MSQQQVHSYNEDLLVQILRCYAMEWYPEYKIQVSLPKGWEKYNPVLFGCDIFFDGEGVITLSTPGYSFKMRVDHV